MSLLIIAFLVDASMASGRMRFGRVWLMRMSSACGGDFGAEIGMSSTSALVHSVARRPCIVPGLDVSAQLTS
ncbi:hypothetical protein F5X68DRAFT_216909 [Plectosphaerella plurivora]|uniref:Secreted protein n=1 Tax=Plectosphaerella plurivora TaxID=936078 RepID=A0A9P8UZZ2_9PEZI|nr:hypothetical protein F5X68DRAFT_216909 [Plectosphaerella plurivora]